MSYFVDCHCHMFTIADVPLYNSIYQFARKGDKIHNKLLLPFAGIFLMPTDFTEKAQQYEKYIRFFEHEPHINAQQLVGEASLLLTSSVADLVNPTLILTPLVMDFDCGGNVEKLEAQIERLKSAIANVNIAANIRVLPFIGLDPRRGNYSSLLAKYDVTKIGKTLPENGNFVGVKLYPPLGFRAGDLAHSFFYTQLLERDLPVTVHCQKDSFRLTLDDEKFTHPNNWEKLLATKGFENLRINFAHFGGEDEVANAIDFRERDENIGTGHPWQYNADYGVDKKSWTYSIIRMLKRYPNTYADIAAFDAKGDTLTSVKAIASFHWLLHLDSIGQFNDEGNYKLIDKLMWGSDYPMSLGSAGTSYLTIFNEFRKALQNPTNTSCDYPQMPTDSNAILRKLVCDNPKAFLGLP